MNPLLFEKLFEIIKGAIARVLPDPQAQAQAQAQAYEILKGGTFDQQAAQALAMAQINLNTQDAKGGFFQSGWRPAIGWTCAGALFSQYVLKPWIQWAALVAGHPLPELPGIDDQLWQLIGGMLGMGGLRTLEKLKGKA